MKMKRVFSTALLALGTMAARGAWAQPTDHQARTWAASCAACHGTNGKSLGGIVSIAGTDKALLLQKLLAYKKGELPATVMHQHAKGYSDAELERLADFFSRQPR